MNEEDHDLSDALSNSQEQLFYGDPSTLSTFDLLTLLLDHKSSAHKVLAAYPTLKELEAASATELLESCGLESTSVARLLTQRELSHRCAIERSRRGTSILDSSVAYNVLEPHLCHETREVVHVLALNTKSRLLCPPIIISIGTIDNVFVHPREVCRPLIRVSACSCILSHFHPSSGEPTPSVEDLELTTRLKEAGRLLGIPVQDHLVIGHGCYISLADRCLM